MSIDLGRRLIAAGRVSPDEVEAALFLSVARGVPLTRVLLDRGSINERDLEAELERVGGLALRQVVGAADLVARLPRAMCRRLAALPTRVDPTTGVVDVAAADTLDPHVSAELGFHLGVPIRVLRAPIAAIEDALRRLELDEIEVPERARPRRVTPPFPHGAPQSDIPPPVLDETPIPLVRKAPYAPDDGTLQRASGTLMPPAGAPPLASLGLPAPPGPVPASPSTVPYPGYAAEPGPAARGPTADRNHETARGADRTARLPGDLPAVSFPSGPPPERITPPYGTPAYDPNAASRAPSPGAYRIAPPADDPYALGRAAEHAPQEEDRAVVPLTAELPSPPARKQTLPSAQWPAARDGGRPSNPPGPAGARRSVRPVIGDMPYPASIPPPAPVAGEAGSERGALPDDDPDGGEAVLTPGPRRLRAPDGGPVLDALEQARSRDDVIREAMRGMRLTARRIAVFAVKRDGFYGWACNVELGDSEALRALRIPADQPSVLATATATAIYLGPIPATPAHEGLFQVMERASSDVAAVAVRVAGRPALVLLCDELDDTLVSTRFLVELARRVGEALARLLTPR